MEALGQHSRGPGRVYLTGGATAVLKGWRDSTVAIEPRLERFPGVDAAAFRAKLRAFLEKAR